MPRGSKSPSVKSSAGSTPGSVWDRLRGLIVGTCVVLIAVLLATAGLITLRTQLDRGVLGQKSPPRVQFVHRPAWMTDFLHSRLVDSIRPDKPYSAFDHELLVQTTQRLQQSPWVLKVNQVRRAFGHRAGDTLEVDCDFRSPVALVKWNESYWLVDNEGVKLPEEYASSQVPRVVIAGQGHAMIRIIDGVRSAPPAAGEVWNSPDLHAGLDLAKLLFAQPYAEDVVKIDVANFQGRDDVRDAQILLVTRFGSEIRWGRPLDAVDYFIEVPSARKVELLQQIFAQYHRLDAGHRWIDIRFDSVTYPGTEPADQVRTSAEP